MERTRISPQRIPWRLSESALNTQKAVRLWLLGAHRVNRAGKDTHPGAGCVQVAVKEIGGNLHCVDAAQKVVALIRLVMSAKVRRLAGLQYQNERL